MKEPGFSTEIERPFKERVWVMRVASVMETRSLTSPPLRATVPAAPRLCLSVSYLAFREAVVIFAASEERSGEES